MSHNSWLLPSFSLSLLHPPIHRGVGKCNSDGLCNSEQRGNSENRI